MLYCEPGHNITSKNNSVNYAINFLSVDVTLLLDMSKSNTFKADMKNFKIVMAVLLESANIVKYEKM